MSTVKLAVNSQESSAEQRQNSMNAFLKLKMLGAFWDFIMEWLTEEKGRLVCDAAASDAR